MRLSLAMILTVILMVLKSMGYLAVSWFWVGLPMYIFFAWIALVFLVIGGFGLLMAWANSTPTYRF